MYTFAKLNQSQLAALQKFEAEAGYKVLAVTDLKLDPEQLDAEQLAALRKLEEDMGTCLVAVQ
jgi:hypothetical protein